MRYILFLTIWISLIAGFVLWAAWMEHFGGYVLAVWFSLGLGFVFGSAWTGYFTATKED